MSDVVLGALEALWHQVVIGLGLILVLGVLLYVVQWATHRLLGRAIGFRGIAWWTGWIGTPIHELSHTIVGRCFGLEIVEVRLFAPDPETGVLGRVKYVRPPLRPCTLHKVVGTFLMGIAPLFGGTLVLWLAWILLIRPDAGSAYGQQVHAFTALLTSAGPGQVLAGFWDLLRSLYEAVFIGGAGRWQPWVFLYVALCVGAHLAPSNADLRGGAVGAIVLVALGLVANIIALAVGATPADAARPMAAATASVAGLLVAALLLNIGNLALAAVLAAILGRRQR